MADVVSEFKSYGVNVEVTDPYANSDELMHEYGYDLVPSIGKNYDAVVVAVNHKPYMSYDEKYFQSICASDAVIVDLKGILRGKIKTLNYWSL